jgi:tartrate-resistant acid phosphatase type 5
MFKNGVTQVIGLGDYAYTDTAANWHQTVVAPHYQGKFKGALGNHDKGDADIYAGLFGQTKGAWNFVAQIVPGELAVVFINTESGITEPVLESLTKTAKTQAKHVVYAMHYPFHTSATAHHKGSENKSGAIINTVAKRHGIKLITAGHNHNYEHHLWEGIHYLTVGTAGKGFYPTDCKGSGALKCTDNQHGFLKVQVGENLYCQFIQNNGTVFDSFIVPPTGSVGTQAQAVQQFLQAYISPSYYITRNRR